jgi:hypothetical protein
MTKLKIILISVIFIGFTNCKEDQKIADEVTTDTGISTFYFIRHAEKDRSDSENSDPELNQDGIVSSIDD